MVLDWLGRPGRGASAEALIARGKYEKAIDLLEAEVSAGRRDPRLRLQLSDALVLAGKRFQAVPVLLSLADEFAREGFAAKAISVLKRIEKIDPGRRDVDAKLAALIKDKQRERAPFRGALAPLAPAEMEPNPVEPPPAGEAAPAPPSADAPAVISLAEEVLITIEDALAEAARAEEEGDAAAGARPATGPRPLVQSPLFDDFTEEELLAVIRGLRLLSFEPGDVIVAAGDTGDSLFVLTAGSAKAFVRDGTGRHVLVREMGEGTFFGEISILTGSPRTATVTARTRCDALELDRAALESISAGHPRVREVLQAFCQHRMDSDEWLARRSAEGHAGT
jgi:tetratricopeptide (TPR) repeat protein